MRPLDRVKRKWWQFLGRYSSDVQSEIASTNAEIEFVQALKRMQATRGQFDSRVVSSSPPAAPEETSISELSARLTIDDELMKGAINELEEEPH